MLKDRTRTGVVMDRVAIQATTLRLRQRRSIEPPVPSGFRSFHLASLRLSLLSHPFFSLFFCGGRFLKDTQLPPLWSWRSKPRNNRPPRPRFVSSSPRPASNADKTSFSRYPGHSQTPCPAVPLPVLFVSAPLDLFHEGHPNS